MQKIRILAIDDDPSNTEQLSDLLDGKTVVDCELTVEVENDFSNGIERLQDKEFDIVILDVYQGDPSADNNNLRGKEVLQQIKETVPIAVILNTALPDRVQDLKSDIVRVVHKSDGDIKAEVESLIRGGVPLIKQKLLKHVRGELTRYYWVFAEKHPDLIATASEDHLFEYLIARRLALTLDKEGTKRIFGDGISDDKVHPLSMYIFPPIETRYEMGDILKKDDDETYWVVMTPSCDFAQNKAAYILIAPALLLTDHEDYQKYSSNSSKQKYKDNLSRLVKSTRNERYYFLPRIQMIGMPDLVIDLQQVSSFIFQGFEGYTNIAKLDDPYSQDLMAMFTRSQNRPGSPDIDDSHIIGYIDTEIGARTESSSETPE